MSKGLVCDATICSRIGVVNRALTVDACQLSDDHSEPAVRCGLFLDTPLSARPHFVDSNISIGC
jgi:hypothetical protein